MKQRAASKLHRLHLSQKTLSRKFSSTNLYKFYLCVAKVYPHPMEEKSILLGFARVCMNPNDWTDNSLDSFANNKLKTTTANITWAIFAVFSFTFYCKNIEKKKEWNNFAYKISLIKILFSQSLLTSPPQTTALEIIKLIAQFFLF